MKSKQYERVLCLMRDSNVNVLVNTVNLSRICIIVFSTLSGLAIWKSKETVKKVHINQI